MPAATTATDAKHDVVIVGGGLVGASLAIALDRIGLDVAMVDAAPAGTLAPVFDERNLSFSDATVNALAALGVMDELRAPVGTIRSIHVSSEGDFGRVVMRAVDYERDFFGKVVIARDFGAALEARLGRLQRLTRYRPARFMGLVEVGGGSRGVLVADEAGERVLATRLVVGADGTRSQVRDALGIAARSHDYAQTLFVARVRARQPPDGTAYERFRRDGPTAMLPRGDRQFGSVHAVSRNDADDVAALDEAGYLARLQHAFGWRVGRLLACGERSAYPALRVVAERCISERAVLVGNAAQTLHPIGAQGFNLGLRDALTLAELLERHGLDAVDGTLLEDYTQRRREDRERTLAFSDGLARITANRSPLASALRGAGFLAADRVASLQSALAGGAMGYRGDVPALCRATGAP